MYENNDKGLEEPLTGYKNIKPTIITCIHCCSNRIVTHFVLTVLGLSCRKTSDWSTWLVCGSRAMNPVTAHWKRIWLLTGHPQSSN